MYLYPSIDLKFLFIMPTIALLIFFRRCVPHISAYYQILLLDHLVDVTIIRAALLLASSIILMILIYKKLLC